MMESAPALVLEEVSKRFGRVLAVDRLSLRVEPGQLAGFLAFQVRLTKVIVFPRFIVLA